MTVQTLMQQCFMLRALVHAAALNMTAISACKAAIENIMDVFINANSIGPNPFVHSRYRNRTDVDVVFEALCYCIFDDMFKKHVMKHKHTTREFMLALAPYYRAGALKFSGDGFAVPLYYVHRFRTRRYSFMHKINRHLTKNVTPKTLSTAFTVTFTPPSIQPMLPRALCPNMGPIALPKPTLPSMYTWSTTSRIPIPLIAAIDVSTAAHALLQLNKA